MKLCSSPIVNIVFSIHVVAWLQKPKPDVWIFGADQEPGFRRRWQRCAPLRLAGKSTKHSKGPKYGPTTEKNGKFLITCTMSERKKIPRRISDINFSNTLIHRVKSERPKFAGDIFVGRREVLFGMLWKVETEFSYKL